MTLAILLILLFFLFSVADYHFGRAQHSVAQHVALLKFLDNYSLFTFILP